MKKSLFLVLIFLGVDLLHAQEGQHDSVTNVQSLQEFVIFGRLKSQCKIKPFANVDDLLDNTPTVDMIKRGGYAWEPTLNNMASERTIVTIEGMRIFGACTDRMDPITSYVETLNLSEAKILSGQRGSSHGATIGGTLNFIRNSVEKQNFGWNNQIISRFQTNDRQKTIATMLSYKDSVYAANIHFTHRQAENYRAGGRKEVDFSQFTKYNIGGTLNYTLSPGHVFQADIIYDKATNVGYPALPMDVSLAQAVIGSVKHEFYSPSKRIKNWETKLYYNAIVHQMDDSKRPDVPIHMDMPGWSNTSGFYSKLYTFCQKHEIQCNANAFFHHAVAEMTMHPKNSNEKSMFMYTWPHVSTLYGAVFLEDTYRINDKNLLVVSTNLARQLNEITDSIGLSSLQIFYPKTQETTWRNLKSFRVQYVYAPTRWRYDFGFAYGERAPSISEAYGFYLYNNNDFYDYVGNPELKNELSWETSAVINYHNKKFHAKISASYFRLKNYIIGKIDSLSYPMTIGAKGIKKYTAINYAEILASYLQLDYQVFRNFEITTILKYNLGKDNEQRNLPFIAPLAYNLAVKYEREKIIARCWFKGQARHRNFAHFYGENSTNDYRIVGCQFEYHFPLKNNNLHVNIGIDNLFDRYYSTFADWNNIPRMGRNVFLAIEIKLRGIRRHSEAFASSSCAS